MLFCQFFDLLERLAEENFVCLVLWIEWSVCHRPTDFPALADDVLCLLIHECVGESLPDVADGGFRWVNHVGCIEPVVAQFVHHDLVGRKIGGVIWCVFIFLLFGVLPHDLIYRQKQCGFAQLVDMESVAFVPDGADGEEDLQVRIHIFQECDDAAPSICDFIHTETSPCEHPVALLVAVRHDLPGFVEFIDDCGSESDDERPCVS